MDIEKYVQNWIPQKSLPKIRKNLQNPRISKSVRKIRRFFVQTFGRADCYDGCSHSPLKSDKF
jgi:hypothetical protein